MKKETGILKQTAGIDFDKALPHELFSKLEELSQLKQFVETSLSDKRKK